MHEMQVTCCKEDKWLVACKETWFVSPMNNKLTYSILSSHQVVIQQQELELVESQGKHSLSFEVCPGVNIILFQARKQFVTPLI